MTPSRVRQSVVAAKSDVIARMLADIDTLPLATVAEFTADPRMVAAGESFLRRCLEAVLDLGRHVLAKAFGRPVAEYKEIARELGRAGVLDENAVELLTRMAGYRNRLVHFYDEVTPTELHRILTDRRGDVGIVLESIRQWLRTHPDRVDSSL